MEPLLSKIVIKTPHEIELMREASRVTRTILDAVGEVVQVGSSTQDINSFVHRMTLELGATPAPLNYKGFPKSVCTSLNEVVCHGIPDPYQILKAGDIINVDVTSIKGGYHGDSSRMFFVGGEEACSPTARKLVHTAREALYEGIKAVKAGGHIGDIGAAIERFIAKTGSGYGIVRDYTGHGIGASFHESPQVVHAAKRGTGPQMCPGQTFTVEPMINEGSYKTELSRLDGWTVRTADGKLSAQWEHTVLVTETGCEILTKSEQW